MNAEVPAWANVRHAPVGGHGNAERASRPVALDVAAIAKWNARNRAARAEHERNLDLDRRETRRP